VLNELLKNLTIKKIVNKDLYGSSKASPIPGPQPKMGKSLFVSPTRKKGSKAESFDDRLKKGRKRILGY